MCEGPADRVKPSPGRPMLTVCFSRVLALPDPRQRSPGRLPRSRANAPTRSLPYPHHARSREARSAFTCVPHWMAAHIRKSRTTNTVSTRRIPQQHFVHFSLPSPGYMATARHYHEKLGASCSPGSLFIGHWNEPYIRVEQNAVISMVENVLRDTTGEAHLDAPSFVSGQPAALRLSVARSGLRCAGQGSGRTTIRGSVKVDDHYKYAIIGGGMAGDAAAGGFGN